MLLFALNTFRMDDDEVQKVHLPLVFSAIIEKLEVCDSHWLVSDQSDDLARHFLGKSLGE